MSLVLASREAARATLGAFECKGMLRPERLSVLLEASSAPAVAQSANPHRSLG